MHRWLIRYRLRANDRRLKIVLAERNALATIINSAEAISFRLIDRLVAYDGEIARLRDVVEQGTLELVTLDTQTERRAILTRILDKESTR